jgi:hypothetical protein
MMPMANMFAPDINFVPARAVYPTMQGGTSASAGGAMSAQTTTLAPDANGQSSPVVSPANTLSMSGKTVWWWLGIVVMLGVMVAVSRKVGGPEEFRNIRPTAYNFLTITLTAIVGIVGAKVLAAKYRIPGASDVILAV